MSEETPISKPECFCENCSNNDWAKAVNDMVREYRNDPDRPKTFPFPITYEDVAGWESGINPFRVIE